MNLVFVTVFPGLETIVRICTPLLVAVAVVRTVVLIIFIIYNMKSYRRVSRRFKNILVFLRCVDVK